MQLSWIFLCLWPWWYWKNFLWNAIITHLRSEKKIVLAVTSSGVASLLLPKVWTAHSRFKIPFNLSEICSVKRGTMLADLIKVSALIIWDEAPYDTSTLF
jgi:ATP-dependent DNA helicase PIF1